MRRHLIIPDTQVRPGVPVEHISWAAQAALDYKPDVIVVLGDWWDFFSLNSHAEKGSKELEGTRIIEDIDVGNAAFELFNGPIREEQARLKRNKKKVWGLEKHFLFGNHEERAVRTVNNDPRMEGLLSLDSLNTQDFERHPFLKVVTLDGIKYSHYFQNINSRYAIGGSIDNRLNRIGNSFVQGHEQGFLYGTRVFPTGSIRHGLVAGSFYQHDEAYKGRQGNGHWRGIVVLNEVREGDYSVMPITMDYLRRKYG
jgi:hypothetical protein